MEVKIQLKGGIMPKKAHPSDAAFDLYVPEDVELKFGRNVIDMGFSLEIPEGYAATIQPRSGFSAKGMEVECGGDTTRIEADVVRGLIDSHYRGNVGVIVNYHRLVGRTWNWIIKKGTRIAQMQIVEVPQVELVEVEELSETDRGEGGFGHTGTK